MANLLLCLSGKEKTNKPEDWAVASSAGSNDLDVISPDSRPRSPQFRKENITKARWKEELGMAEIISKKGRMWTTTGIVRDGGKIFIFLEDVLFLAEIGKLHLLDDEDKCIPLEDIIMKIAQGVGGSSWESFKVYRHLKSLGYIIKRHGVSWSRKTVPASADGESGSQENASEDIDSINEISELFNTIKINGVRPVFDVCPPNPMFRKSCPGNPMFILYVKRNPPTKKHIEDLEEQCEGIPLNICNGCDKS